MNDQAIQLNNEIQSSHASVMEMLSDKGKEMYFPKLGIVSQAAEAKGTEINATIGIALENDGIPVNLPCISSRIDLPAAQVFPYAPSSGRLDLRELWKTMLVKKDPSISGKSFSLPMVTSALTHGLSTCGCLLCNAGDRVIIPDLYWENYELIFSRIHGATLDTFPFFTESGGFNVQGLREKLLSESPGKRIVCLNFPNNPTGYTPTVKEIEELRLVFLEAARNECRIVVIIDDAYFGLIYESGVYTRSVFSELCDLHPNVLAVKLDGATKEDYTWGFRVGFITYGIHGGTQGLYKALEAKTAGIIRATVSNASNLSQSLMVSAYTSDSYAQEKRGKFELLRERYETVKQILKSHPEYKEQFIPLPFNSGYFMCIRVFKADLEQVRQKLLTDYSIGVIAMNGIIRIAFSSTPVDKLEKLFDHINRAVKELAGS